MATMYDISKKTGLSTATVSRVINDSALVKKETRERGLQAIEELNYRPSHAARMLAGRSTDTIGVVLPLLDDGFYVQVLRGIDQVATKENLKLLISFYHNEADLEKTLKSLCGERRTDAIIVSHHTGLQPERMRQLTGNDIPVVLIAQNHADTEGIDCVLINNVQGACCAVQHLLENKPKSLLLIAGTQSYDNYERLKGAQAAIDGALSKPEVSILCADFYQEGGRRVFETHIRAKRSFPDAVFAFNDAMALGVLDVLRDASVNVPEDVQVVGFDGTNMSRCMGLSTVSVPMRQIGEEAAGLAVNRIRDKGASPVSITMETQLVIRETSMGRMPHPHGRGESGHAGMHARLQPAV